MKPLLTGFTLAAVLVSVSVLAEDDPRPHWHWVHSDGDPGVTTMIDLHGVQREEAIVTAQVGTYLSATRKSQFDDAEFDYASTVYQFDCAQVTIRRLKAQGFKSGVALPTFETGDENAPWRKAGDHPMSRLLWTAVCKGMEKNTAHFDVSTHEQALKKHREMFGTHLP